MFNMQNLAGYNVIVQPPTMSTRQVKRTWNERLFSLTPFVKCKTEHYPCEVLEDGKIVFSGNNVFVNETTFKMLNSEFTSENVEYEISI